MRAAPLAALALAGLTLALAVPASAAAEEAPVERLSVAVGYPLPWFVRAAVVEQPDCLAHGLAWQGAWFTVADAVNWAWAGGSGPLQPEARLAAQASALGARAGAAAGEAWNEAPGWALDPLRAPLWAAAQTDGEDTCVLRSVDVATGL